jgi:plastocyanin/uncharacterized membrane protein YozB (DUF420 family)
MQAIFGNRLAADINIIFQVLILVGLYVGFYYARRRKFRPQHANIQTTFVLLNLFFVLFVMVTSFYNYVIAGRTTTGTVAALMMVHALLGTITQGLALYLVAGERKILPKQWRIKKIKPWMRATLALWTFVVLLGVGIYYFRYIASSAPAPPVAQSPSNIASLQFQANTLLIHADELKDAANRSSPDAVRRHAEHIINLIIGRGSSGYGDLDGDGLLEDPGDGRGLLPLLMTVQNESGAASPEAAALADKLRAPVEGVLAHAQAVLAASDYQDTASQIDEIVARSNDIARGTNGVPAIARLLNAGTDMPPVVPAAVQSGTITVDMAGFKFQPPTLSVKRGSAVVFVNKDDAKHTVTEDSRAFHSGDIDAGQAFTMTFEAPGSIRYYCEYHGDRGGVDMAGTIEVTE